MTEQGAERALSVSALAVVGIYAYRRLTEGSGPPTGSKLAQLAGQGSPPPVAQFITAWGFTFLVIAIMAAVSPGLGGSFAILVAVSDALGNLSQVADDINGKVVDKPAPVGPYASSPAAKITGRGDIAPLSPTPPH